MLGGWGVGVMACAVHILLSGGHWGRRAGEERSEHHRDAPGLVHGDKKWLKDRKLVFCSFTEMKQFIY